jgi:hypothetical protein
MAKRIPAQHQTPAGVPGLEHSYGYVREELHPRLRGTNAIKIYREMSENSAVLSGALYNINSYLRRVTWKTAPASKGNARAEREAEFVWECLNDMERSWSDVHNDINSMLIFGNALCETVYKYRRGPDSTSKRFRSRYNDGRVGWRIIDLRAQESIEKWDIAQDGEILGAWQMTEMGQVYLPMSQCALFRTSTFKNNPEGRSILRGAYRSWHFSKRLEETEAVGAVRSLVNLPKVTLPVRFMSPNASAEEKAVRAQYEKMVSLLTQDRLSGLVLPAEKDENDKPTGYTFELVGATGSQMPIDPIIRRYDARMLVTMAAEFLLLGTEKQGSFALGAEKSANFAQSLEYYVDLVQDQFNKVLIPRLMQANGVPPEFWPTLEHLPIDDVSVAALGQFLSMAEGFLTPNLDMENSLRERINVPKIEPEEYEEAREAERAAALGPDPAGPGDGDDPDADPDADPDPDAEDDSTDE